MGSACRLVKWVLPTPSIGSPEFSGPLEQAWAGAPLSRVRWFFLVPRGGPSSEQAGLDWFVSFGAAAGVLPEAVKGGDGPGALGVGDQA